MAAFRIAVPFVLTLGACVADAPQGGVGPTLVVTTAADDRVAATLQVGEEQLAVSSRLEERPALVDPTDPLAADPAQDEMVRTTVVQRASGETVASFSVAIADDELTGVVGGQPFGRPEDESSDDDAARWAAIMDTADGQVIDALQAAALAALDEGVDARAVPFVSDAARLAPALHDLAAPPSDDALVEMSTGDVTEAAAAPHHITTLGWNFGYGPNHRILLLPNTGNVIGIHSATNELALGASELQTIRDHADHTFGIREVEPYEYNTSRAYRRMTARLVVQAQHAAPGRQPILMMFNSGSHGSHDPMTLLPGIDGDGTLRPSAARALRALLRDHPALRLSIELYCAGNMTATEWRARRVQLGRWAARVGIARARITIDEDLSATTATSGEHYGAMGNIGQFDALLADEADHVFHGGWGGLDYVASPPSGVYPTRSSTFAVVRHIMSTY